MRNAIFGAAIFVATANLCLAQTASSSAKGSDASAKLEEIIVTALKTTEEASKTPVSLSVLSGDDLKDKGVVNINQLQYVAPSIEIGSAAHGANVSIRGVSTTDITSKGEQAVSFNLDGIAIGRPQIMGLAFFDIDRVEVLRGPQGTLYGKSSTAGAINVITAKPKDTFDAAASFEVGNFNTRRGEAMINVPVTDNFAVRVAASTNVRDGYLNPVLGNVQALNSERPLNDENNQTGRLSALWKFGDTGSWLLQGTFGHIGGTGDTYTALYNRYKQGGTKARQVYYNPMAGVLDDHFANWNTELNFDLGAVHVTYTGGSLKFNGDDNYSSSDNLPSGGAPTYSWTRYAAKNSYDSHEIRLSNANPQRFEYVLGGNYWKEGIDEIDENWQTYVNPNAGSTPVCTQSAPNLLPGCNGPGGPHIVGLTQHKAQGIFGQGNFHATDDLKFTVGLRYSSDSMFRHSSIAVGGTPAGGWKDQYGNACAPPNYCVDPAHPNNDFGQQSASKMTWRIGADYQIAENHMIYGYVATGYKAGSFNDVDPTVGGPASYGPEDMTAYEVGYKGKPQSNIEIDTAAYYYDYSKYQLTGATAFGPVQSNGNPGIIIYTTLVPMTLYGWEGTLKWNFTQNDIFNMSVAVESGHFKGGPGHATVGLSYLNQVDWSGKRLDSMPPISGTLSYEHRWEMSDGGYLSARLNSKISGSYYQSALGGNLNFPGPPFLAPPGTPYSVPPTQYRQDSYTRTDFNLGYTSESGKFSVDAFVRNIEDKMQLLGAPNGINAPGQELTDTVTVRVSAPRTFGMRIGVKYQ